MADVGDGFEPPAEVTTPPLEGGPTFECSSETAVDSGRDGVVDGWTYGGWDPADPTRVLYMAVDENGNGLYEYIELYERDAAGNATRYERQRAGAQIIETTYDERGNELTIESDLDADGIVDEIEIQTWDANDKILSYDYDSGGDGDIDYRYDRTWTPEGWPVGIEEDTDGDGDVDNRYAYTLDEVGRPVLVTVDEGDDGTTDEIRAYAYTDPVLANGEITYDYDNDGVIDERWEIVSDEEGRYLSVIIDEGDDGILENQYAYEYDDAGRTLSTLIVGPDATVNGFRYEFTYAYDSLGRTVHTTGYYLYNGTEVINTQSDTTYGGSCP